MSVTHDGFAVVLHDVLLAVHLLLDFLGQVAFRVGNHAVGLALLVFVAKPAVQLVLPLVLDFNLYRFATSDSLFVLGSLIALPDLEFFGPDGFEDSHEEFSVGKDELVFVRAYIVLERRELGQYILIFLDFLASLAFGQFRNPRGVANFGFVHVQLVDLADQH